MKRLSQIWIQLKSSLWFMPSVMVFVAIGLAFFMVELDSRVELGESSSRFLGASADGARKVLATIAGSVIMVAGVIFSVTIVSLSLSANAYTPRILRNFMRDKGNQIVLGFFVSLFTYCLIVLRTIRGGDDQFIPAVSVALAIVLAIVGIYLFIYMIHHSATTIQAAEILAEVSAETVGSIQRLFPEKMGEEAHSAELADEARLAGEEWEWKTVAAASTGYIQVVDSDALIDFAEQRDGLVRMERGVGDFVIQGAVLASVSSERPLGESCGRELNAIYGIDRFRNIEQDPAFGIRQIVDMALKALSPSSNDSTTAVNSVDHLAVILHCLMQRRIPSRFRYKEGKLRVIARAPELSTMVHLAFHEVRQNADGNVALMLRILERMVDVADVTRVPGRRNLLWQHVQLLREKAAGTVASPHDRDVLDRAFQCVAQRLGKADQWIHLSSDREDETRSRWPEE